MKKHFIKVIITLLIGSVGVTQNHEFNIIKKSNTSQLHIDPIHPTTKKTK